MLAPNFIPHATTPEALFPRTEPMTDAAPRFLQVHWLASYPATLLNRDDSGFAKRLPFGEAMRTRVSSQCLKRHWRVTDDEWALKAIGPPMAVRSRQMPELRLRPRLDEANAGTDEVRDAVVLSFAQGLYGDKAADVSKRQALLLGEPELDYLATKAIDIARSTADPKAAAEQAKALFKKEEKSNLSAMRDQSALAAGLEAALFGRMVTSDPEANTDAAVHVAHAFTVHAEATESDYFTVVDDLTREAGEAGTAGLFDTELTAGLFYGYVVLNLPLLISNLGGDAGLAGKVAEHLVHLIATVSPGAKKGSTAPYAYAETMLIESGRRQPRTLANAFRAPVSAQIEAAEGAMRDYVTRVDASYGAGETRRHLALSEADLPGSRRETLDALAGFAREETARAALHTQSTV
jgi:CRISPR system Cascade subunit CasC